MKDTAEKFAKELENEFGSEYNLEELLKFQSQVGLITPKGLGDYDIRNEFIELRDINRLLPKKERRSNTGIVDDMAAAHNCSPTRIFSIVRDSYHS